MTGSGTNHPVVSRHYPSFQIGVFGVNTPFIEASGAWEPTNPPDTDPSEFVWSLTVSAGGSGAVDSDVIIFNYPGLSYDISGSWSMSLDVEEIMEIQVNPVFVGQADAPYETIVSFYERPRAGGNVSVSCTTGGCSASVTNPATAGMGPTYGWGGEALSDSVAMAGDCIVTALFGGVSIGQAFTASGPEGSASLAAGLSAHTNGTSVLGGGYKAFASGLLFPDKTYALSGVFYKGEALYPGQAILRYWKDLSNQNEPLSFVGGSFSTTQAMKQWNGHVYLWNNGTITQEYTNSVAEWWKLRAWKDYEWMNSAGEDARNTRVLFRGKQWNSFTCQQAASRVIDDGSSVANWSNVANTSLASVGGAVQITVSGGTGSCDRAYSPPEYLEHFRYLRVRAKADAASQPLRVTFGTKQWDITVGTSYADYDLDLRIPSNSAATVDGQDSRWPLTNETDGIPQNEGALWGVNRPATLRVENLANGRVYDIDAITLVAVDRRWVTFWPAFEKWLQAYPSQVVGEVTSTTYYRRFVQGDTDGRLSLEIPDMTKLVLSGSVSTTTYATRSIANIISDFGTFPSWSASASAFTDDGYHNNTRDAVHAMAGGLRCTKEGAESTASWKLGFDLDASSALQIVAQGLYDELSWYPGCGDPFGFAGAPSFGQTFQVRAGAMFGGQVHGIAVKAEDNTALSGGAIATFESGLPSQDGGTASTDSRGRYQTGAPYQKGNKSYDTELRRGNLPYPKDTDTSADRFRLGASFRASGATAGGNPSNRHNPFGHYDRVEIVENTVYFRRSDFSAPVGGFTIEKRVTSGITWSDPHLAEDDRRRRYILAHRENPVGTHNVYETVSDDDGATWSTPTLAIANGHKPRIAYSPSGDLLRAALVYNSGSSGPGKINATFQGSGDTAQSAVFVFKDQAAADIVIADDSFDISAAWDGHRSYLLTCRIDGETSTSDWQSWDDARTWIRVS